jgi:hypothetical protein
MNCTRKNVGKDSSQQVLNDKNRGNKYFFLYLKKKWIRIQSKIMEGGEKM